MTVAAGLFLIAHGLVHLAIWLPEPRDDAPFDPRRSWLLGDRSRVPVGLAICSFVLLVLAGALVVSGAEAGPGVAAAGAAVSLALVLLTFHVWFIAAVAINVAIIVVAVA